MEITVPGVLKLNELRFFSSVFSLYFAYSILRRLPELMRWYDSHRGLFPGLPILGVWKPAKLSPAMLAAALVLLAATLLVNALLPSRWLVVLALALFFLTFPVVTSFHLIGNTKSSLAPMALVITLLSNEAYSELFYLSGGSESARVDGGWPLVAIRLSIAFVYFGLGIEKLRSTGWRWASGRALRWYLVEHYAWGRFRPARLLVNRPAMLRLLSSVTLGMQLLAPLIVLGGWFPAVHGLVALGFHLSTQIFMGIYFLPFFGPIVLTSAVSYPFARLSESLLIADDLPASLLGAGPPDVSAGWQIGLMFAFVLVQLFVQVKGGYKFPFMQYSLFSHDFSDFRRPGILLLEIGDREGNYQRWRPRHYYDVRDISHFGYDLEKRRTQLSSLLEATFRMQYWPMIQREMEDGGSGISSIRLIWRFPAWKDDELFRYDDFMIGRIPIVDGQAGDVELLDPEPLRVTPL